MATRFRSGCGRGVEGNQETRHESGRLSRARDGCMQESGSEMTRHELVCRLGGGVVIKETALTGLPLKKWKSQRNA